MSKPAQELIPVEVAYARPERQALLRVDVPAGTTIQETIERSGIADQFPEIDPAAAVVGVFGQSAALTDTPAAGDRVEIYRPLIADPKAARRKRAKRTADEAGAAG